MYNKFFLMSIPMFQTLTEEEIEEFDKITKNLRLNAGDILFEEDEPGYSLYIIKHGSIEIYKQGNRPEEVQILTAIEKGAVFGEMSLIESEPRSACARAAEPTELISVSKLEYDGLEKTNLQILNKLQKHFLSVLSSRLRLTSQHYTFTKATLKRLQEF